MMEKLTRNSLVFALALWDKVFGEPELDGRARRDRGDVPGWVMITVMTAIVVVALVSIFGKEVQEAITKAFSNVNDSKIDK